MSEFICLYRGGVTPASPEQMQKNIERWVAWFKELATTGHLKDRGIPLEPTGKVLKGKQKVITDGPYAEGKDVVGGYSMVEAKDIAHALELLKDCPIFDAGGSVEVRPVQAFKL